MKESRAKRRISYAVISFQQCSCLIASSDLLALKYNEQQIHMPRMWSWWLLEMWGWSVLACWGVSWSLHVFLSASTGKLANLSSFSVPLCTSVLRLLYWFKMVFTSAQKLDKIQAKSCPTLAPSSLTYTWELVRLTIITLCCWLLSRWRLKALLKGVLWIVIEGKERSQFVSGVISCWWHTCYYPKYSTCHKLVLLLLSRPVSLFL